jgi:pyruvate dehydrogenase E2 component (dihydrolipoamide acetyltransferase)
MSESVNLPALGESVTEGTVTRWLKKVGDRVEVDEPLLEVSTDKVDTEIPSPVAGVIEAILVAEDETVEVGTALVTIGDGSGAAEAPAAPVAEPAPVEAPAAPAPEPVAEAVAEPVAQPAAPVAEVPSTEAPAPGEPQTATPPAPAPVAPAPAAEPAPAPAPAAPAPAPAAAAPAPTPAAAPTPDAAGYVTPLVRKLAHESGVDLSAVTGTGVGGRIRKQDVLAATSAPVSTAAPVAAPAKALEVSPLRGTTVAMSRLRKVIAERAVISMQSSAQLTSVVEVDVTLVAHYRDQVKAAFQQKTGVKLSFLPFFALAAAEALTAYPIINATIEGDSIVYPAQENISIAVDTERGLLTPVIRDAAKLDLAGFAAQIADLAERTRDNKLKPDELAGGTFTLTNTGSQSAILGTGIVTKKPVVVSDAGGDAIAIRSMVYLALSYDHRIVDGADAARFLVAVKDRLEGGDFAAKLGI